MASCTHPIDNTYPMIETPVSFLQNKHQNMCGWRDTGPKLFAHLPKRMLSNNEPSPGQHNSSRVTRQ